MKVPTSDTQYIRTVDNLIASRISLKLHLQSLHFVGSNSGGHLMNSISSGAHNGIVLKCTAQIGNLYQESTEIELGVPQRDPIPARVTSSDASQPRSILHLAAALPQGTLLTICTASILIGIFHRIHLNCR